jgi:hypothetical protein
MAMEFKHGQVDKLSIKENLKMIKEMDMDGFILLIILSMMVYGKMITLNEH